MTNSPPINANYTIPYTEASIETTLPQSFLPFIISLYLFLTTSQNYHGINIAEMEQEFFFVFSKGTTKGGKKISSNVKKPMHHVNVPRGRRERYIYIVPTRIFQLASPDHYARYLLRHNATFLNNRLRFHCEFAIASRVFHRILAWLRWKSQGMWRGWIGERTKVSIGDLNFRPSGFEEDERGINGNSSRKFLDRLV